MTLDDLVTCLVFSSLEDKTVNSHSLQHDSVLNQKSPLNLRTVVNVIAKATRYAFTDLVYSDHKECPR